MSPRAVLYRGQLYAAAEPSSPLAMDWAVRVVKDLLRGSAYAQDRFDHSSQQRFDDDLDVAATILVNSIFHDVVFEEPGGNFAGFYGWLVQHYPRESTPAAVYNIVRGLRQYEPDIFRRIVQKVRPGALSVTRPPKFVKVGGAVYELDSPPRYLRFKGALYRIALQVPTYDSEVYQMVRKCSPEHSIRGKDWCVYLKSGAEVKLIGRHSTEIEAKDHAQALLFRKKFLGR